LDRIKAEFGDLSGLKKELNEKTIVGEYCGNQEH
jgi:hypothetical protein